MNVHFPEMERHFSLPKNRVVELRQPILWLRLGWREIWRHRSISLTYGAAVTLAGMVLMAAAWSHPYLIAVIVTGFLLVAPLASVGIYELHRRLERNHLHQVTLSETFEGFRRNSSEIGHVALLSALMLVGWERLSAILFSLYFGFHGKTVDFFSNVFLSGHYDLVLAGWIFAGFLFAVIAFVFTVITVPMLVDREVDFYTAVVTSFRTVVVNLPTMVVWAALIVAMTAVAFLSGLLGMIVILPWLAHANWHAYRDMVQDGPQRR